MNIKLHNLIIKYSDVLVYLLLVAFIVSVFMIINGSASSTQSAPSLSGGAPPIMRSLPDQPGPAPNGFAFVEDGTLQYVGAGFDNLHNEIIEGLKNIPGARNVMVKPNGLTSEFIDFDINNNTPATPINHFFYSTAVDV